MSSPNFFTLTMFTFAVLASLPLVSGYRTAQKHVVVQSHPTSLAELPPCPCTIYSGFCSRYDLSTGGRPGNRHGEAWGAACVAAEDSFVTMHWMVQCVPDWKNPLTYGCPSHLSVKCDASRTQEPCDTSALGHCDSDTCKAGSMPKVLFPAFCQLGSCTQSECCEACPAGSAGSAGSCQGPDGASLPDTCCQEPEKGSEWDNTPTCQERILSIAEPTTMRMQAYSMTCMFNPSDVDMSAPKFALTPAGQRKLCEPVCQSSPLLQGAPMDVWATAQDLATECDDPALTSQISPVGLFAAAGEMDRIFRVCAEGGPLAADGETAGFISKDALR